MCIIIMCLYSYPKDLILIPPSVNNRHALKVTNPIHKIFISMAICGLVQWSVGYFQSSQMITACKGETLDLLILLGTINYKSLQYHSMYIYFGLDCSIYVDCSLLYGSYQLYQCKLNRYTLNNCSS